MLGRLLHLIAASLKAMTLGAIVKEKRWGNIMVDANWWTSGNAMVAAEERDRRALKNNTKYTNAVKNLSAEGMRSEFPPCFQQK